MFYVLSPTFQQHNTAHRKKRGISFPTCYRHTYGVKKEKQTQKIFPIPSWCTPTPTHRQARAFDERTLPLCQACELVRRCSELAAIFSRTENAHQRKFLMLLTIKSKYLVRAFYSSLSWCKSTKGINEESQVLRMALKIFI